MMPSNVTLGHLFEDPAMHPLSIETLGAQRRYTAIVYRIRHRRKPPVSRALIFDRERLRHAAFELTTIWRSEAPMRSRLLVANNRLHLLGAIDPQLGAAALSVVAAHAATNWASQLSETFPIINGALVADVGPAGAQLSLRHATITAEDGAILWQTIGHPSTETLPRALELDDLDWYNAEPGSTLTRICCDL